MKPRRAKHRSNDDFVDDDRPDEDDHDSDRPRRKRRPKSESRKRRKLPWLLLVVLVLIALLPTIVAKTPLRNLILAAALPTNQLHVTVGDASLSWYKPPSIADVHVTDAAGDTLLTAEAVRIDRAPGNLLLESRHLGLIEIVRPSIYLKIRADGNNIEDALLRALADVPKPAVEPPAADSTSQPVEYALQIVDGTIFAEDATTGRRWRVQALNVLYDTRGTDGGIGRTNLAAQIADLAADNSIIGIPGQLAAAIQPDENGKQQLTLQANGLSLGLADAWLRRFVPGTEVSGALSGQGTAHWTPRGAAFPNDLTSNGTLAIERLDATAPALAGDRIRLALVEVPWRLAAQPAGLKIELLQLRSDVGQAAIRGTFDPTAFAPPTASGAVVADAVARHDVELRGSLDLARLATMLPHAMRIRANTTITSGTIQLAARSQPADGGQLLTGSLQAAQLAATNAGRPLRWDQPVSANFTLRRQQGALHLDALKCDSDFLKVDASGTPQQLTAAADFDLNRLAEQLGQFVDLSGIGLAGTGTAKLDWRQTGPDQFSATATGELAQLRMALDEEHVWTESQLAVRATAAGALDPLSHRPARVDTAQLGIRGGGDQLDARLLEPVGLTSAAPSWPVAIRATGRIANWLTRARPWFAADPWQVDGQSDVTATARIAANSVDVAECKVVITDLRATSAGWNINEPRAELTGDAHWNGTTGEISANSAQLVTSAVSLATKDVRYCGPQTNSPSPSVGQLIGQAAFRVDPARLAAWRAVSQQSPPYLPSGEITGQARFTQQGDRLTGELNAIGVNLALAQLTTTSNSAASRAVPGPVPPAYQTIWQEPQLTLRSLAAYESQSDRLTFSEFQIQSNTLQAAATGQVEKLSTAADIQLNGTLNYDLAQITPLLKPYLGEGIQLVGREQARFALAGQLNKSQKSRVEGREILALVSRPSTLVLPHWSRRVRAQLEMPWSGANVYGLPIGPGKLAAVLGDGKIRVEPLALAVGEGQLTAAPNVRLDPPPSELTLPKGPLITNVRISPEVSEAMLKYVAPVLAGATRSEGLFSLQLDAARVPLGDSKRADAAGQLTVHAVRVVPGPMAQQWVGLAQQIESLAKRRDSAAQANREQMTLLSVKDQQVNFRVVDGRVYHQNMEFQVGDVALRSQGSVGFDETVSLTLTVPIQDAWITSQPLLSGLKGQSLQIPISGTLTRPQMDQRAIAGLTQQLLQGAAQQAIGGELNKALDKLFKPR